MVLARAYVGSGWLSARMGCVPPSPRRPHSPCRPGIVGAGVCRIDAASVSIEVTASGPVIPMPHLRDRGAVDAGATGGPERWRRSGESGKDAGSTRRPRGDCWGLAERARPSRLFLTLAAGRANVFGDDLADHPETRRGALLKRAWRLPFGPPLYTWRVQKTS